MRADRAESHEAMLRERLKACRASEQQARAEMDSYRCRMAEALRGRGALADRLVEAVEADRTGHKCPAVQLGLDRRVVELARRHRSTGKMRPGSHDELLADVNSLLCSTGGHEQLPAS